jgi:phosphomannomutase
MTELGCFKAYDVRGRVGVDLDDGIVARIAQGFATHLKARQVVLGHDSRATSPALHRAAAAGLTAAGAEVLDLGLCGTEEVYHATTHFAADGGIEITASHNPADWNGLKMVGRGSTPIGPEALSAIRRLAEATRVPEQPGGMTPATGARAAYVAAVLSFVDPRALAPLHILVNAGNGTAGPTFDAIAAGLAERGAPLRFTRLHHDPDPAFPNGIPNPLLPENHPPTADAVRAAGADFGVAWDGDFDRCFFFDHTGRFIPGEYLVGLLAGAFLHIHPGAAIVFEPRVIWNTEDAVARAGGRAVMTRTGHAFLKQAMRDQDAVYGGEISAHHYFRDFMYCDSGMIPWLVIAGLVSRRSRPLADLVADRMRAFPSSGEVNFRPADAGAAIARVIDRYAPLALSHDRTDGDSLSFADWRFNLRRSNTESLVRLNVESRGDADLVARQVAAISTLLEG